MTDEPEIWVGSAAPENTTDPSMTTTKEQEEDGIIISPEYDAALDPLSILLQTKLWSRNPAVVVSALQELADVCDGDNNDAKIYETKQAIYDGAGGFAIAVAMKNNYTNVNVQIAGCHALSTCGDANSYLCKMAMKCGAISTILLSMQKFNDNTTLQAKGCAAIRMLIVADWTLGCTLFKQCNGPVILMTALSTMKHDAKVALYASDLIGYLTSCGDGLPDALVDEGALEALGTVARKFKEAGNEEHDKIREQARNAINSLLSATSG